MEGTVSSKKNASSKVMQNTMSRKKNVGNTIIFTI